MENGKFLKFEEKLLDNLCNIAQKRNYIKQDLYSKYDVKRGLRDQDGRGVLVGLTEIGDVHSYILDENEMVPVPGRLRYRGYDVNDLVRGFMTDKRFGFEEITYLLLFGGLPTKGELEEFVSLLANYQRLPEEFARDMILKAPSKDIMNGLARSVLALYSYDDNPEDTSIRNVLQQCLKLIALFPSIVVYCFQAFSHYHGNKSLYIHSPNPQLSLAENILYMLRPDMQYTPLEADLLDLALVLHAEHGGGNNSSFVTHVVTSTGTDTYSVIASALGSLKGPRHGGANIKVIQMIEDIKANVGNWEDDEELTNYLSKILSKDTFDKSGLIYGVGHAIYSISDPRALILKDYAGKLASEKGLSKEYNLYASIERLAPPLVIAKNNLGSKVVCANVDFYSGFVYKMLNIPVEMFTPIFAIARISGWGAHRIEEIVNSGKIIRPAYKSVAPRQQYIPINQRNCAK
ncbi:Citrate synthase [Syntrophobotulus glycolicus DSM 8271]|uniref:Citrate synthase n=1 Tax=Syntrophobotulus glycolicus (strain DSM 8271 / FlGlyR) TaxID=645991 RepID=F0T0J9_SYNGF|nr:citrate/2-methylcitrate synthase [Syntrophobotulus glycolicus]ADY55064.1 Citrate synthase [Syntrophobotulus glycolicus DSM 8271]